jgi:hypothetical protein
MTAPNLTPPDDDRPWSYECGEAEPANDRQREPGDDSDQIECDEATASNPWESRVTIPSAEWYKTPPPKRAWLLRDRRTDRGVLPLGKVGQVIGEGGVSKTEALVQLAVAIATATPWLGTFEPAIQGRVLLILGEEDAEEVQRRLYHARRAASAPTPPDGSIVALPLAGVPCPMIETDQFGNTSDASFAYWLQSYVKANGPFAFIAIDPLSRFAGPKAETDNAAATRFIQTCESVASLTGATILIAHHTNKMSRAGGPLDSTSGRGSSAFVDGARWQAALSVEHLSIEDGDERQRLGDLVTFAVTKSNYAMKPEPVLLRRDPDNGGALLPIGDDDRSTIDAGRAAATKSGQKRAAKEAEDDAKARSEDAAIVEAVTNEPGLSLRALASKVRAATGCGKPRSEDAVERMAPRLRVVKTTKGHAYYPL